MEQIELLRLTLQALERLAIPYALVGSYGISVFGEPRFTRDIDILIELPRSTVSEFCAAFPSSEYYLAEAAVPEAIVKRFQFKLIHPASGNKVDFILPRNDEWGRTQLSRSRRIRLRPEFEGNVAAPEDVIIGKLWYYSEGGGDRHLRDIAGMLRISGANVDRDEIQRWATELGYLKIWQQVVESADAADQTPGPGVP